MRIWHQDLIPKLCQKHLCAMWREALGAYKIIVENRTDITYWKHPATQEFIGDPWRLWKRLHTVREEMLSRGYNPKEMPKIKHGNPYNEPKEWQTLDEQITHLKSKGCKCRV